VANTPIGWGLLTGALKRAAAGWVGAGRVGFDTRRIPLVREAFGDFSYPLASFSPADIRVAVGQAVSPASDIRPPSGVAFRPAEGWRGRCELEAR